MKFMGKYMTRLLIRAVLGAVLFAAPSAAQEAMTINDVLRVQSVGAVAMGPQGQRIAYTVRDPRDIVGGEDNGGADTHLWVYEVGGEARPFVTGEASVGRVAWRPGTGTITFTTRRDGDDATALYEIDPAGGEARRLFAHAESIGDYVWGPQGETLYFVAREDQPEDAFADRGFTAYAYEEGLSYAHVWQVSVTGSQAGQAQMFELDGHASDIEISADGSKLAVALAPTPLIDDRYMARRWHVIEAAGGAQISEIATLGKTGSVAFSPDGSHLAMLIGSDEHDPTAGTLAIAETALRRA
jgi:dipeptidyl aminopeptidase/acylaminoacyl peptidase